jgi:crotonobetainyl-CoA:carnitine CoA-transferase CaiB-like acyl-CoA transferase
MGAEIIKVELPVGDYMRKFPPYFENGDSAYFTTLNAGFKSVVLDFKTNDGLETFK